MLFGAVFLMCASWTMQVKEHIRIDIVNNLLPKRVQQWIDLLGHLLFLLPFCALMVYHSGPFFMRSYQVNMQSLSAGGLTDQRTVFRCTTRQHCTLSLVAGAGTDQSPGGGAVALVEYIG